MIYLIQPTEAPMPAFDKDKHIMNKIDGVGVQVNVSLPVAFFFNNENPMQVKWLVINGMEALKRNHKIFL